MMSTRRHKMFGLVLGGVLSIVLAGCAQAPVAGGGADARGNKHYRIGVTVYGQGNFITQGQEGMMAYAKANNIDLLWNAANNDVNTQASQMEQLVAAGVDAIIIVPVQYDSLSSQIQAAKDKGIPVIAVNTTVKKTDLLTSSVQPDDVAAGEGNAEIMAKYLKGKGDVVILQCVLGSSYELARTKGMQTVLAKYPNIKLLTKGEAANNGRAEGATRMKNWLTAFPTIDGVVSCGDDPGLGALQAIKEAGKKIAITGIDGVQDGMQAVKSGDFVGTMLQHGRVELGTGVAVAKLVLDKKPYNKLYTYKMKPITKDNVDQYMDHVVTKKDDFLKLLPALIDQNLKSGNISNENL
jgi:ribose transport system substrate-binding protein